MGLKLFLTDAPSCLYPSSVPDCLPRDVLPFHFYGRMEGAKELAVILQEYLSGIGDKLVSR